MNWTPAEDALLRELHASQLTFGEIAAHFPNRTRNSVIGRAKRLGLPSRADPSVAGSEPQPRHTSPRATHARMEPMPALEPIGPLNDFPDARSACRYIIGDPAHDWQCCGHPVAAEGAPYCGSHMRLCHTPNGGGAGAHRKAEVASGIKRMFGG